MTPAPGPRTWGGYGAIPALAALLFLGVAALGVLVGYPVLPVGELGRPPYLLDSLFHWDALDYLRVAQHGYQWNALRPTVGSDIAFYPAYPLIEAALGHVFRSWAPALLTLPSVLFGIAAIFAFDRLALRLLAPRGATVATFGYALYPAACFTLNGYPTSLINLALVLMFAAVVDRRLWRFGCWASVATLAGPLAPVAALAVPLQFVTSAVGGRGRALGERVRSALSTSGTMLLATCLAFSGILGFVAYQAVTLGNPTAFISAQQAWGYAALGARLARAVTLFPLTYYYG